MATSTYAADFLVSDHGTIFLLSPVTKAATEWADEHLPEDAMHFGSAIVVEHRFISAVVRGFIDDGLTFEAS